MTLWDMVLTLCYSLHLNMCNHYLMSFFILWQFLSRYVLISLEKEAEVLWHIFFNTNATYHVHLHLHMHWSYVVTLGFDHTGTHRMLPEEGCDVKEVMSLAFICIHEDNSVYLLCSYKVNLATRLLMRSLFSNVVIALSCDMICVVQC